MNKKPEELKQAFMTGAELKKEVLVEKTYLTHDQWKKAWLQLADCASELVKRRLKPDAFGTFSAGKNRERLGRYITDQEDAYFRNLERINEVVENLKRESRQRSDAKKAEIERRKEHLEHEAARFQALRGMEKRLLLKKEQEEKSKKRLEEKVLRNKLLVRQEEARLKQAQEIAAKNKEKERLRMAEVRALGFDKQDHSMKGWRKIPLELYNNEPARLKLSYTEVFDISRNLLEELPSEDFFYYLSAVKKLNMSQNRVTELPLEFGKCLNLELFEANTNRLRSITPEIGNLTLLQRLDLSNNQIDALPESFGLCTNLKSFKAHSNNLKFLPHTFGNLSILEYCDISRNKLHELPEDFRYLQGLTHLNLSSNRIGHLPHEFGECLKLAYMDVSTNLLSFLPQSFGRLSKLEYCNLTNNELMLSADCFTEMVELKTLLLGSNSIKTIFPDFGNCKKLSNLDLRNNKLSYIPPEFGLLASLQELTLARNELRTVPPEIGSLFQLQKLDISYNSIEGLFPDTIGSTPSILNSSFIPFIPSRTSWPPVEPLEPPRSPILAPCFPLSNILSNIPSIIFL